MSQGVLSFNQGQGAMRFYCGYAFGGACVPGFTHAIVTTPRYVRRALRESRFPIVLDNGAFPAFRDGAELSYEDQRDSMLEAIELIGDRLLWAVLPDVVANAAESFRRADLAMAEMVRDPSVWLLPIQEGAPFSEYAARIRRDRLGGAFVGGSTKRFKFEAASALNGRVPWVHVARICRRHELEWAQQAGVHSFDSTTPTRAFEKGRASAARDENWAAIFQPHCEVAA